MNKPNSFLFCNGHHWGIIKDESAIHKCPKKYPYETCSYLSCRVQDKCDDMEEVCDPELYLNRCLNKRKVYGIYVKEIDKKKKR